MTFLVLGGNGFGLLAPIVIGYVVAATGSFDAASEDLAVIQVQLAAAYTWVPEERGRLTLPTS
jgi:hypothetical protein